MLSKLNTNKHLLSLFCELSRKNFYDSNIFFLALRGPSNALSYDMHLKTNIHQFPLYSYMNTVQIQMQRVDIENKCTGMDFQATVNSNAKRNVTLDFTTSLVTNLIGNCDLLLQFYSALLLTFVKARVLLLREMVDSTLTLLY